MGQAVGDDLKIDYKLTNRIHLFALYDVFTNFMMKIHYKNIKIAYRLNFRILLIIK